MGPLLFIYGVVCVSVCSQLLSLNLILLHCLLVMLVIDWRIQSVGQISRHSGTLEPSRYLDFDGRSGKIGSSLVEDTMVETAKEIL
jgi:hypothetical protein